MPILPIRLIPDPVLREETEEIESFDKELHQLLESMGETMYASNGIGLAAPQIGVSKKVVVLDVSEEGNALQEFVNPEIVEETGSVSSDEGCLSIPGFRDSINRKKEITVKYKDRTGKDQELHADGLLAICLQHEIDHLNGILFVDRLSRLKKEFFKRWLKRQGPLEAGSDGE